MAAESLPVLTQDEQSPAPADQDHGKQAQPKRDWPKHKQNARSAAAVVAAVFLVISGSAAYAGIRNLATGASSYLRPAEFVVAGFFLIAMAVIPVVMLQEGGIEEEEEDKCEKDCKDLDSALDKIDDPTLSGLAKSNFRQMRMFTMIALRQARMSYYASLAAAFVSLLVLAVGSAVTDGLTGESAKITAASLTAAGSALSGLLASTFLRTYRLTARQMSYYYGQPLVHCYLLHAEWLTLRLEKDSDEAHTRLWQESITAALRASENAQTHLLSMQDYDPESPAWKLTRQIPHRQARN